MAGRFPLLEKAYLESPVVDKGGYPYFVNPISDGIPRVDPALLEEVVGGLCDLCSGDIDLILAPEAMGIHLATGVSLRTRIPFAVIRKRKYGLPGEIEVVTKTGYSESKMYINGVSEGDRVAIIDDVVSTGGTLLALSKGLRSIGAEVVVTAVVYNKSEDLEEVRRRTGLNIRTMLDIGVRDGRPVIM